MKWLDSLEIAITLNDNYPDIDPLTINFVDLRNMVINLTEFDDNESKVGEKILEAIQMYWIEEK